MYKRQKQYGGVIATPKYHIKDYTILDKLSCTHHAFFIRERLGNDFRLEDPFYGITANNPITLKVIELLERNIFEVNQSPDYIKYPCNNFARVNIMMGCVALSIAFAQKATENYIVLPKDEEFCLKDRSDCYNIDHMVTENDIDQDFLGAGVEYDFL